MDGWETFSGLGREEFERLARFSQADNHIDNINRARALGFLSEGLQIAPGAILRQPEKIRLGKNVFVGLYVYLNGDVTIEDRVLIGPHCSLSASNHIFNPETQSFSRSKADSILVRYGAWLAAGCMVTAGATVGKGTLVCANAVVTRDTPDFAIMAGTPARQVGHIDPETGEYHWYRAPAEDGRRASTEGRI